MSQGIVVINVGSTSVKFAAYRHGAQAPELLCRGRLEDIGSLPRLVAQDSEGNPMGSGDDRTAEYPHDPEGVTEFLITWLEAHLHDFRIDALGHRVVHGGSFYDKPVLVDEQVITKLEKLATIEPSHQPFEVGAMRAVAKAHPGLQQVAVFDTAYHRTLPSVAQRYALPDAIVGDEIRHWGFHGISYEYLSRELPRYAPKARRVIVAHLGGGASMCAMLDGKSMDTSMGFGAIDGLPMSTRCGAIDPQILLYLMKTKQYTANDLEILLYKKSGLLGLSGSSGDMRLLREHNNASAAAAIDYFIYHIVKFAGAYTAVLGGLDAFVFTAGIGENDPALRAAVVERLAWLGAKLDSASNIRNGPRISMEDSHVSVWVIPTDEELMIARHTAATI
jgi:acetate kinase